ncbi:hypothetical protein BP6252_08332 [Coleophoma cylindrospora]|uniref:U6 small nuclear RNA (adenine-(43)-N(6))-methyltransferase n=1 Tax=Coleophoma cylindrospora TaxID=1849047 RepID=A0A3D8R5I0_9HELO|nr:hypothetical protein BP6252_08332 [Coleophoma cylindrospora]
MALYPSPYQEEIDFSKLALQDADFAKVLKSNGQLDFSNPEAVQQLTKSLLKRDFGLKTSLPSDRLCPPVPNRLNYILWVQALLDCTSHTYTDTYDPERQVLGLDVGTGASCIYPLLGCAQRPNWRFAGTDIDDKSLKYAQENIQLNNLDGRVKLLKTSASGHLLPLDRLGFENIDFTMCNPPFYESNAEMLALAQSKQRPPNSACTGSANEMVTPGGEVAFITKMISESLLLRDRVQWYTSMCGRFSSITALIEILRKHEIDNYAIAELVQGSKTRRWVIAWSFDDLRPTASVARGLHSLPKNLLPVMPEYIITQPPGTAILTITENLNSVLSSLSLKWMWRKSISTGLGFTEKNVWSRASRRQATNKDPTTTEMKDDDADMALGFKINVLAETDRTVKITVRWLKGHDSVLFESFCGMIKRKLVS